MTRQPGTIEAMISRACKCKKCNAIINKGDQAYKIVTPSTYYFLCTHCHSNISAYSTRNNQINNKPIKSGITLGIEHEQAGNVLDYRALMIMGWIPTSDCTVDVEYKSPIFQSLRGLKLTLETLENAGATSGDNRSGTHCHIGTFSESELSTIQSHAGELFDALQNVLYNDRIGTIDFFGRFFSGYCNLTSTYNDHSCWLNLYTRKPTIELRLSKFQNAQQYYRVMILARFIGQILKSFLDGKINVNKASNKFIAIYRKCKLARDVSDIIGNNNRD